MALFDPAAIDRQISSIVATIPQGSKVVLLGNYNHQTRTFSIAVAGKVGDHVQIYGRVGKPIGKELEADAGIKIHYFVTSPELFLARWELFKILSPRVGIMKALSIAARKGDFEEEIPR